MRKAQFPDPFVLIAIAILFALGAFVLYTTAPIGVVYKSWLDSFFAKQLLFGVLATIILVIILSIDLQLLRTLIVQIAAWGTVTLLLLGLFFLGGLVNETHRWYKLGPFLFQPSEFAKIVAVLWSAYWLTQEKATMIKRIVFGIGGVLVMAGLIIIEPDFGATIVMLTIVGSILLLWLMKYQLPREAIITTAGVALITIVAIFTSLWLLAFVPAFLGIRMQKDIRSTLIGGFVALGVITIIWGSVVFWNSPYRANLPSYVRERIESFLGESEEKFQIRQAKIAVGSGQFWGKGLAQGTQSRLRFLPEYTTDFIFASLVEERGYAGMILLLSVYLLLYGRLLFLALTVEDEFTRLIMVGLTVKLWFETFVNIGMNMGVLPTKGFALPFVSYGGSSLLANTIIIGIMLSLYRFEKKHDTIPTSLRLA